nr:hypothetical protein [Streptomyces sp. CL12-4]
MEGVQDGLSAVRGRRRNGEVVRGQFPQGDWPFVAPVGRSDDRQRIIEQRRDSDASGSRIGQVVVPLSHHDVDGAEGELPKSRLVGDNSGHRELRVA